MEDNNGNGTEKPRELDRESMDAMLSAKERIRQGFPREIEVNGHTYKVRQISKGVRERINALELEAYMLSGRQKETSTLKKAKRIQRRLDRLHAKTAAYYLLGNRAVLVPGLFAFTWRKLMLRGEEDCLVINNTAINDEELNFSSANWDITKLRLALSMKPIGDSVRETLKRWEAAAEQSEQDATKGSGEAEDKSGASSRKPRKTRR